MNVLNIIDNESKLLDIDVEYLARCYIEENTNFELPMSYDDTLVEIDYQTLVIKVRDKITVLCPSIYINEQLLMSYVDYYFQFINST